MRVAICIITLNRPLGLKRLIDSLECLEFRKVEQPEIEIIIVENDSNGPTILGLGLDYVTSRWEIQCAVEPRRGIPFARNKAIELSAGSSNFIAFIDDDEVAEKYWLDELLWAQRQYDAHVVAGPVVPLYEEKVPSWIHKGKFFERSRFITGTRLKYVASNNVLVNSQLLAEIDQRFDTKYPLNGGDDTHLFLRLYNKGCIMIWADEAVVSEWTPGSRTNMKWLLRRAYRLGNSITLCEKDIFGFYPSFFKRMFKASTRIIQGALFMPIAVLLGKQHLVKALQRIYRGAGAFAGLFGSVYQEYRQIHGR